MMPTINGIKMACAPCIRGHRSTKCNHADERLMVPVRKPGRPLSACPHPQDQPCGCGSVTAAIPRKQQCGCGDSAHPERRDGHSTDCKADPVAVEEKPIQPSVGSGTHSASSSPTMKPTPTFRVQKLARPQMVGRKQSYDTKRMAKLGLEDVNAMTFDANTITPQPLALMLEQPNHAGENEPLAWNVAGPKLDTFAGQIVNGQPEFANTSPSINTNGHIFLGGPATPPIDAENTYKDFGVISPPQQFPGYTRHLHQQPNGVVIETRIHNVAPNGITGIGGHWVPPYKNEMVTMPRPPSQLQPANGGERSCCSSKRKRIPDKSSVSQEASNGRSCCSGKRSKSISNSTSPSTRSESPLLPTSSNKASHANHMTENFPASDFVNQPGGFEYMSQPGLNGMAYPTVFAYPPAYGSYHHPLQPAQWKQGVQYNTYAHMMSVNPTPPSQGQALEVAQDGMDTLHSCGCGDGCECVGCAAHPYNDATQKYIRSAWEMGMEQAPRHRVSQSNDVSEKHSTSSATGHAPNTNGEDINGINTQSNEASGPQASSPAVTPSDSTSDDPPLSASDFFFVNYHFADDGCGGDTQSCPCGDDCACFGCFIHNNPNSLPAADSNMDASDESAGAAANGDAVPKAADSCCASSSAPKNGDAGAGSFTRSSDTNFDGMCGGDETTCPCPPESCECIGCIIHAKT